MAEKKVSIFDKLIERAKEMAEEMLGKSTKNQERDDGPTRVNLLDRAGLDRMVAKAEADNVRTSDSMHRIVATVLRDPDTREAVHDLATSTNVEKGGKISAGAAVAASAQTNEQGNSR